MQFPFVSLVGEIESSNRLAKRNLKKFFENRPCKKALSEASESAFFLYNHQGVAAFILQSQ